MPMQRARAPRRARRRCRSPFRRAPRSAETLTAVDDQPDDDRADQRADERADDPAPEAVGQEDREVPDREAHHHPAEHAHQRDLPWRRLRGAPALRARLGLVLEHEVLGRQVGGRVALGRGAGGGSAPHGGRRARRLRAAARGAPPAPAPSPSTSRSRTSSWNSSREICCARLLGRGQAPRACGGASCSGSTSSGAPLAVVA